MSEMEHNFFSEPFYLRDAFPSRHFDLQSKKKLKNQKHLFSDNIMCIIL